MMVASILATAILGALWRRVLGGWGGLRRSWIFVAGLPLAWPLFMILPPFPALILASACLAFWAPGHEMTDDRKMLLRYGPFAVGWIVARHLKLTDWTSVGELTAGFLFWGALAAAGLLFYD